MDTQGLCIVVFSFLAVVLLVPPLAFHCKQKNIPACSLIGWLCYNNLVNFINALIWSGEKYREATEAKGYCDLTVRITSGSSSGKLAAIATLIFNLYTILAAKYDIQSRKKTMLDWTMCWATPVFVMATSVIAQSTRYIIERYRGCTALYSISWVTIVLTNMWELLWAIVAFVFAAMTLFTYFSKRRDVKNILRCTSSGLNLRRFARLLIFSVLIVLVLGPYAIVTFAYAVLAYGKPGFSMKETHGPYWNNIYYVNAGPLSMPSQIIDICLAFCTFFLFGLGTDALAMYMLILARVGLRRTAPSDARPDIFVTENLTSRNNTRKTQDTDATAFPMQQFEELKEYMYDDELELQNTRHNTIDLESQTSPESVINIEYNVIPK